jgi:hypothetical protein
LRRGYAVERGTGWVGLKGRGLGGGEAEEGTEEVGLGRGDRERKMMGVGTVGLDSSLFRWQLASKPKSITLYILKISYQNSQN